jgi:hypothetical protein
MAASMAPASTGACQSPLLTRTTISAKQTMAPDAGAIVALRTARRSDPFTTISCKAVVPMSRNSRVFMKRVRRLPPSELREGRNFGTGLLSLRQ